MQTINRAGACFSKPLLAVIIATILCLPVFNAGTMAAEDVLANDEPEEVDITISFPKLQPVTGLDNPSLAYGLSGIVDYNSQLKFVNIMKHIRPWIGHSPGKWGGVTYEELLAGGYLDDNGWVEKLPPGLEKITAMFAWADSGVGVEDNRAARYVLIYEGEGNLRMRNVSMVSQGRNRLVFDVSPFQGNWWFEIYSTAVRSQ